MNVLTSLDLGALHSSLLSGLPKDVYWSECKKYDAPNFTIRKAVLVLVV